MGGRRESDTALLHGLSQCDSQCGSLDASIARQRRTIAQLSAIRRGGEAATTRHDRCNVSGRRGASHYLSSSSFARDLSDFARLSLTALFVGNWSRIYKPALIYRVLMLMSS